MPSADTVPTISSRLAPSRRDERVTLHGARRLFGLRSSPAAEPVFSTAGNARASTLAMRLVEVRDFCSDCRVIALGQVAHARFVPHLLHARAVLDQRIALQRRQLRERIDRRTRAAVAVVVTL